MKFQALPLLPGLLSLVLPLARAQDTALSDILIQGESWEVVSDAHEFTDAPCADADGNFYFADVKGGMTVNKVDLKGELSHYIVDAPGVSGAHFAPDGRIYACQPRLKRVVAFKPPGKVTVLAENVQPNDLVVSHRGFVYFTETRKQQVTIIDPEGKIHETVTEIVRPNGIAFSPDQTRLAVSDHGGKHVWTFVVNDDGLLSDAQATMTARTPPGTEESRGDGMTTDSEGRYYVTTSLGVQIFDAAGRLSGILPKPQEANLVSAAFAGPDLSYLYLACGDKIYRRKTKTRGVLSFQKPR